MAVLLILEIEGVTAAQYDRVDELLGVQTAENAPEGLISHSAGVTGTGLVVADVWESPEDIARFFRRGSAPPWRRPAYRRRSRGSCRCTTHLHGSGTGGEDAVIAIMEIDGMTTGDYDAIIADMAAHAGDGSGHPAVSHAAAVGENGLVVVDVWGSEQEFGKFGQDELAPRMGGSAAGLKARFAKLHKRIAAKKPAGR